LFTSREPTPFNKKKHEKEKVREREREREGWREDRVTISSVHGHLMGPIIAYWTMVVG